MTSKKTQNTNLNKDENKSKRGSFESRMREIEEFTPIHWMERRTRTKAKE